MFSFLTFASLILAVLAIVVPRQSPPPSYDTIIEPYDTYRSRYIALSCWTQPNTTFFADCCYPLMVNQSLDSRPPDCRPAGSQAPPSKAAGAGQTDTSTQYTGGFATYFYQNGVAGACEAVHQDSDLICALDSQRYSSDNCGRSVRITNTNNGNSVTAVIADDCPTCDNDNSLDLSRGAFEQIATLAEGMVPIVWEFV